MILGLTECRRKSQYTEGYDIIWINAVYTGGS
jgi:hypothetical protein